MVYWQSVVIEKTDLRSPRRGGGQKSGGPKGSPWGISPEEKTAKNKSIAANQAAKK